MESKSFRLILCAFASCVALISAPSVASPPLELTSASFMEVDGRFKSATGHPNEEWRFHGLKAYLSGRHAEAIRSFERAAGYADKYSQHYLSLIYWHGQGVPVDRVRAYIWSDLAAERGSRKLLAIREKMWAELSPEEREQAVTKGAEFYDRFADAVAKPRAEVEIRRFANNKTGSRVGFNNQNIDIQLGGPIHGSFGGPPGLVAASAMVAGTSDEGGLYAEDRTNVRDYWRAQDEGLERRGHVEVGPISVDKEPL